MGFLLFPDAITDENCSQHYHSQEDDYCEETGIDRHHPIDHSIYILFPGFLPDSNGRNAFLNNIIISDSLISIRMKGIITYIVFLVLALSYSMTGLSQEEEPKASRADRKEQRQWEKEKRQQEKEQETERLAALTKLMVEQHRFVLEADHLSDKYGNRVTVSPTINFIFVDSLTCTFQLGSAMAIGYNGVGGTTIEGRVTNYDYNKTGKDKKSYYLRMTSMMSIGTYDVTINIRNDGYATASIRGNWSGELNYHGKLVPPHLSRIYKGSSTY